MSFDLIRLTEPGGEAAFVKPSFVALLRRSPAVAEVKFGALVMPARPAFTLVACTDGGLFSVTETPEEIAELIKESMQ